MPSTSRSEEVSSMAWSIARVAAFFGPEEPTPL
jgi:hypothetical protein